MNRLYIPPYYRTQHKILLRAWSSDKISEGVYNWPSLEELQNSITEVSKDEVKRAVYALHYDECIYYDKEKNIIAFRVPKGADALFKESFLEQGWEKFKANFLRWTQIFGILSGSLIAIFTFILNYTATSKNIEEIAKLKTEVQAIKQKQNSSQPFKANLVKTQKPINPPKNK